LRSTLPPDLRIFARLPPTTRIILNPAADRGAAGKVLDPVVRAFRHHGWNPEVVRTERPGHATDLARSAGQDGVRIVVAVGGDGCVHEVANGLLAAGRDATLGVVPVGSGNDFAKLVGVYRHSPARAVDKLVAGRPARFDVGKVRGEYFVNSLGFGYAPEVVKRRNQMQHLKGFLSYLVPVLRAFASFRPPYLEITATEHAERGYVMTMEVCNGTTAGGTYRFAPNADPADGLLDVCLIRKVSLVRFLLAVPKVMSGKHLHMREVASFRTRRVVIRSPHEPLWMHLDGELRGPVHDDVTVDVDPGRLSVLVPA
jgi:diacylglycerol kinase (ATP)